MTHEEAIKYMKQLKPIPVDGFKIISEAYDIAIEALKKQIPKKTLEGKYYCEYRCPCCGFVFDGTMPFCLSCGQALDWSEEE